MANGIWSEGDHFAGTLRWGWTHGCGEERDGFGNATTARESLENHAAGCDYDGQEGEPG